MQFVLSIPANSTPREKAGKNNPIIEDKPIVEDKPIIEDKEEGSCKYPDSEKKNKTRHRCIRVPGKITPMLSRLYRQVLIAVGQPNDKDCPK